MEKLCVSYVRNEIKVPVKTSFEQNQEVKHLIYFLLPIRQNLSDLVSVSSDLSNIN